MNTYEINNRNEVIPYTSGRRCSDTRAWRDATELELQQQDAIKSLETEFATVTKERDEARGQRDSLAEALRKLADCDWIITPHDRMDAVREIARDALQSLTTNEP